MLQIQFIQQKHLDKTKWDHCITNAVNGLIYGYSWYLDAMAEQWDALVLNDYEAVMPLTWNKKFGVHYLYQPFFCASLGVFTTTEPDEQLIFSFLKQIPKRFKYIDIYLNQKNLFSIPDFPLTVRTNYVLPLSNSYSAIFDCYRNNLKRNLKKAEGSNVKVKFNIPLADILHLSKANMQRISPIPNEVFEQFKTVLTCAGKYQKAETLGIYSHSDQLLASAVFLFSHNRWYYILVGNHPNGKTLGASHYLIDQFISKYAGTNTLLDFEGSDIRNLAFFYSSFGATEEKYPALRMNRLPAFLKWMKN